MSGAGGARGRFITIEGIEGAGKSSQMRLITEHLEGLGRRVVATREPGGTPLGESLRGLLLHSEDGAVSADAELLAVFAARAEHLSRVIRPALRRGEWVVCDRFTDATYAYQGAGRGIPAARIAVLEQWVQGELRPDLTLLLDVPVETGLERTARGRPRDRFEREDRSFFERVRGCYLERARAEPRRCRIVDGRAPAAQVGALLLEHLQALA